MNGHNNKNSSPDRRSQEENPYFSIKKAKRKSKYVVLKSRVLGHGQ
jgi:hypothetical protein